MGGEIQSFLIEIIHISILIFLEIFLRMQTESAIVLHVRLIWVQNEAPKGFQYFLGCLIRIRYYFSGPPFLRPKWRSKGR